jgi:hypothetical protein
MASAISIPIATEVPILLQIVDGDSNQYPQAEVRDNEANLLTTINLSHQAKGVYVPASPYVMPNETFIKVTYIVYSNAAHTTESQFYLRDVDVFYKMLLEDWYVAGGNRLIANNREYFYKQSGDTAMVFKLLDDTGDSTMTNVYQRVREF